MANAPKYLAVQMVSDRVLSSRTFELSDEQVRFYWRRDIQCVRGRQCLREQEEGQDHAQGQISFAAGCDGSCESFRGPG